MFENLKAFIRHGKNANEFKGRYGSYSEMGISSGVNGNQSSETGESSGGKAFPPLPWESSNLDGTWNTSASNTDEPVTIEDSGLEDAEVVKQVQETKKARNKESRTYKAATQIVEQENIQKKKEFKYPNLERYEVLEQMGEGAFSIVYKARHTETDRLVAIKILRKFQMDLAQKQAVLKEVTIMRQLNHPNIVKFVEFIDSTDYYYIVQELAIGGEIFTSIVNYTYFSEDLARHIIVQVAEAIRYLHEEVGIVHRDIKPENLLFVPIEHKPSMNPISKLRKSDDPNTKKDEGEFIPGIGGGGIGVVKLADFGLSKQIWEHNTKTPCGTVGYTAPEIVRDERYSKEVDMWAIGCVFYTLLCGFPPFYDEVIETLTEKVARGEYTFLSPWWDEISLEAKHCITKLLTVDPLKRYTIDDFLNDPWVTKQPNGASMASPKKSQSISTSQANVPTQITNDDMSQYRSKGHNYNSAATALREAFDISSAVHRMGEEAALSSKMGTNIGVDDLLEEDEDVDMDAHADENNYTRNAPRFTQRDQKRQHNNQGNAFDLNLGGASILERRKNKPVAVQT